MNRLFSRPPTTVPGNSRPQDKRKSGVFMSVPEVLQIFEEYTEKNIPHRFIDLERLCLVDVAAVRDAHRDTIESIEEADIERHTSYANQPRKDIVRTIVKSVVKYAILSHTWDGTEFLYRDMVSGASRNGPGWHKLAQFCDIAKGSFRCRFAWADMVCIDFTDRRDRESATQSLFDWYRNAYVCIAYLAGASDSMDMYQDRWFYRGWTLTELLAPTRVKFYGSGWKLLNDDYIDNDKADGAFLDLLSKASRIPADDLRTFWPGPDRMREKLSWVSKRITTRVEDRAYSLMAMFDSRIHTNYGEGHKAFTRLMVDVIPRSGECDVFAWAGPCSRDNPALPLSPAGFGERHRDQQLNPVPHHYRLCGDRSLSIYLDHLRIRVILLEIRLPLEGVMSYTPVAVGYSASISQVTPLHYDVVADQQMAVGVIDYGWTGNPDEGILHKGDTYFGFLLSKSSGGQGWEKVPTEKVVFVVSGQELVQKLEPLCISYHTMQTPVE